MLHDKDIREPLFDFLEATFGKIRIIEEIGIGRSRADAVMITPKDLYGIEIKSDADTYVRLETQIKDYDKYFDYNYVVVGSTHGLSISDHVPKYWGIITVEEDGGEFDFYILKEPEVNPKVKWKRKIELLWRPELAQIQEWNRMPKYRSESKAFVAGKIIERLEAGKISEETLKENLSNVLFERDYDNIEQILKEYKQAELLRKQEKENDPAQRELLMAQRARAKENFANNKPRRWRRRRK